MCTYASSIGLAGMAEIANQGVMWEQEQLAMERRRSIGRKVVSEKPLSVTVIARSRIKEAVDSVKGLSNRKDR